MLGRVAVLVSGGGTNLQALIDAKNTGGLKNYNIELVISNKKDAFALSRAKKNGIKNYVFCKEDYSSKSEFEKDIINVILESKIDLIVLAGFNYILSSNFVRTFENKIINIHPSLIPSFCGDGFYGLNVHKAVLEYGVKVTGATVHFVNEVTDGGKIILQKAVDVKDGDTPEILQKRVMEEAEFLILPKAVKMLINEMRKDKG